MGIVYNILREVDILVEIILLMDKVKEEKKVEKKVYEIKKKVVLFLVIIVHFITVKVIHVDRKIILHEDD